MDTLQLCHTRLMDIGALPLTVMSNVTTSTCEATGVQSSWVRPIRDCPGFCGNPLDCLRGRGFPTVPPLDISQQQGVRVLVPHSLSKAYLLMAHLTSVLVRVGSHLCKLSARKQNQ